MPWHRFLRRLPFVFREAVHRVVTLLLSVPQRWALHGGGCTEGLSQTCYGSTSRRPLLGQICPAKRAVWPLAPSYPKTQPQGVVELPLCALALCCCPRRGAILGLPFQAENESLHISPSKSGDPSTQLLRGFCVMQSAPSHTRKEGKRVTLSASQPHVRESPSRDTATGGEGSVKEVSLSQMDRFWET